MAGLKGAQERFARKVERCANLARFEDVANTVRDACLMPVELILKRLVKENLFQLFNRFFTEEITFRLLRSPLLRLAMLGFKSTSFPV